MNIVLFDTASHSTYADAVCLDNGDAVRRLVRILWKQGCVKLGFAGWDEHQVSSVKAREREFSRLVPEGPVCRIPWSYHNRLEELPVELVEQSLGKLRGCDGIIYAVGELGMLFERRAKDRGLVHQAAMIDACPGAEELGICTLEQDFQGMAEKIFDCLEASEPEWKRMDGRGLSGKGTCKQQWIGEQICSQWELISEQPRSA